MHKRLHVESYEIPGASLGLENPFPRFRSIKSDMHVGIDGNFPEEDRKYLGWNVATRVLPYRMQDSYDCLKSNRSFRGIVLENRHLRAVFLPELGGRLVSLLDKKLMRELLYRNPVFQPANLALRDAWFSGGIEWNIGQLGHSFHTCSPVFAARISGEYGEGLRIYEFERCKCLLWQIDFHLPPDSKILLAHFTVVNLRNEPVSMYWWTNIAIRESRGSRVIAPAYKAYAGGFEKLSVVSLPDGMSFDMSYSTNYPNASEMFYRILDEKAPWIASVNGRGHGMFEISTSLLKGRKCFVWGQSPGGRNWQKILSKPRHSYLEIQAGLARTQLESIPMPPLAEWRWTEVFGPLHGDSLEFHQAAWDGCIDHARERIHAVISPDELYEIHAVLAHDAMKPPVEIIHKGSGWGALELMRRRENSEKLFPPSFDFPVSSLTEEQKPWISLLEGRIFPEKSVSEEPGEWMIQREWEKLLSEVSNPSWIVYLHLGVMRVERFAFESARKSFMKSVELKPSLWAYRNLAELARIEDKHDAALEYMAKAFSCASENCEVPVQLAAEYANMLMQQKRFHECIRVIARLPAPCRSNEKIIGAEAMALIEVGDYLSAERLLKENKFTKIREGDVSLMNMWFKLWENRIARERKTVVTDEIRRLVRRRHKPPANIDFRMK